MKIFRILFCIFDACKSVSHVVLITGLYCLLMATLAVAYDNYSLERMISFFEGQQQVNVEDLQAMMLIVQQALSTVLTIIMIGSVGYLIFGFLLKLCLWYQEIQMESNAE